MGESYGSPIKIKKIPDDPRPGVLDPREFALALETLEKRKATIPTLENLRKEAEVSTLDLSSGKVKCRLLSFDYEGVAFEVRAYESEPSLGKKGRKALVYAHGGSYIVGSASSCENALKYLAEISGCAIYNIDYSLAPEHPFPCALEEFKLVIDYLKAHAPEEGIDPSRIYLGGDSAGASLALGAAENYEKEELGGLVLFYPVVSLAFESLPFQWKEEDFEMDPAHKPYILPRLTLGRSDGNVSPLEMMIAAYYLRHGQSRLDPRISPLYYPGYRFPKALVFTCEYDGLRQQGEYFASKLNKEGGKCECIRYKGIHHAFLDKFGAFPQASDALVETSRFLKE